MGERDSTTIMFNCMCVSGRERDVEELKQCVVRKMGGGGEKERSKKEGGWEG